MQRNSSRHWRTGLIWAASLALLLSFAAPAAATSDNATDFTYQGYLTDASGPVTGSCGFQFTLHDAAVNGAQIGGVQNLGGVPVADGVFSVTLDFGVGAFDGQDRFLAITVDCGGGPVALAPRQPITPAPYSQFALGVPWAGIVGVPADLADGDDNTTYTAGDGLQLNGTTFSVANDAITSSMIAPQAISAAEVAQNAITSASIVDGSIALADVAPNTFWNASGNSGTAAGQFIGTTDNVALEFRVFNVRALRIIPTGASTPPNIVAGSTNNTFTAGAIGVTISGGGESGFTNTVTDSFGTVGGGHGNRAGSTGGTVNDAPNATVSGGLSNIAGAANSVVGGGSSNTASGASSTVGGGLGNTANGVNTVIAGGASNLATDDFATVGGGTGNSALASTATVAGGSGNTISAGFGSVGGGQNNIVDGASGSIGGGANNIINNNFGTIGGGDHNTISAAYGTIGGGGAPDTANGNFVADEYGTIGGGYNNQAGDNVGTKNDKAYATVGGGNSNTASGYASFVGGGFTNLASGFYALVGGGLGNTASGSFSGAGGGSGNTAGGNYSTVPGGNSNTAGGENSAILGGQNNTAAGNSAAVGGGLNNAAGGAYSVVPGGQSNAATGERSFAAGYRAKADDAGAFIWADRAEQDIFTPGADTFTVRAGGGIYLGTDSLPSIPVDTFINTSTGASLTSGGVWTNASDRNLKADFAAVDGREVLAAVAALPITTWRYRVEGDDVTHMGPVAQDFYAAFGLGRDDLSIGTVDADGVALAAIQGLNSLLQDELAHKDAQIAALESRFGLLLVALGIVGAGVIGALVGLIVVLARRASVSSPTAS
jgi:hypothetical protein